MGIFEQALESLCAAYKDSELFQLVTYDAGACSAHNATLVRERHLHYLFGLTAGQPTLFEEVSELAFALVTTTDDELRERTQLRLC